MLNSITLNPTERKTVRFGIRYGDFVLVYEQVVDKLKPVKQVEDTKQEQPKSGGIDTYA